MRMKNLLTFALLLFTTIGVYAQDLMVTNGGDVIKAYGVEVAGNAIFYRLTPNEDDAIQRIAKGELLMIKREDGTVTTFGEAASNTPAPSETVAETPQSKKSEKPTVDRAQNHKIISSLNQGVTFSGAPESSDENLRYFLQYYADEESVFEDSNIKITLRTRIINTPEFAFFVENKSDDIIRIDLSNSYYVIGGNSFVMRAKGATKVISKSGTKGASVNLGGVAKAAGIGGPVGTVMGATTVGGSTTNTVSEYIEDDTYIVVLPPNASDFLTGWGVSELLDDSSYADGFGEVGSADWSKTISQIGDEVTFGKDDANNLKINSHITYYKGNDLQNPLSIKSTLYLAKVIGVNNSTKDLSKGWSNGLFYVKKPVYPPYTEKVNQVSFYCVFGLPLGAENQDKYDSPDERNDHTNIWRYGLSYSRIYNKYTQKYGRGAFQYGFGVDMGMTDATYDYSVGSGSYAGYHYSKSSSINIRLAGSIGCKYDWFAMSFRPNIGYTKVDYENENYKYCTDYSGIGGGFDFTYDFYVKKDLIFRFNYIGIQAGGINSWYLMSGLSIGYQF